MKRILRHFEKEKLDPFKRSKIKYWVRASRDRSLGKNQNLFFKKDNNKKDKDKKDKKDKNKKEKQKQKEEGEKKRKAGKEKDLKITKLFFF